MDQTPPRTYGVATALAAVRAHILPIVVAGVVVAVAALAFSLARDDEYQATAYVFPRDPGFADQAFKNQSLVSSAPAADLAETDLASIDAVSRLASEGLDGQMSPSEVSDRVHVTDTGTGLIKIEADAPDGAGAAELANAYAEATVDNRLAAQVQVIDRAVRATQASLDEMPARSQQGRKLQARLDDLKAYRDFQTGNLEQVQQATVPGAPESKGTVSSTIGGGIAGLLLAAAGVLLIDRIRPRVGGRRRAEEIFGAPVLTTLPPGTTPAGSTALDALRARLVHRPAGDVPRSVLVVPVAGEPAVAVAKGLAGALVAGGRRAVFVDAALAGADGDGGTPGLAQVLEGSVGRSAAIVAGGEGSPDSIASGGPRADAATVLDRPATAALRGELEAGYDIAVIAGAAPVTSPDSIPLISRADLTLAVVAKGTREDACLAFSEEVERVGGRLGGVVLIER